MLIVLRYIASRALQAVITLWLVSILVFLLTRIMPGDPADTLAGLDATPQQIRHLRQELGLNSPLTVQYVEWLAGFVRGDFGISYFTSQPVAQVLMKALPVTITLTLGALLFSTIAGIVMAVSAAMHRGGPVDKGVLVGSLVGVSVPTFVLGIVLIVVFSVKLRIVPMSGYTSLLDDPVKGIIAFILPSISLGLLFAANLSRIGRAAMLEVLSEDYITMARALGIRENRVRYRYALKNALIPMITIMGVTLGALMGGSVVTERVFTLPGVGTALINAVTDRKSVV